MTRMAVHTTARFNRFNPVGVSNPARGTTNWNRTRWWRPEEPRGGALLLHGLSDSPYSLRAVPGPSSSPTTSPSSTCASRDTAPSPAHWHRSDGETGGTRSALAARHLERHIPADRPLWLVGYSNGAALAVDYTLELLGGRSGRPPDRLLLFSPALAVTRLATFAGFQRALSALPGLAKLAWTDIQPEYDPYKYNSFPIDAAEQIHDLTGVIQQRLTALAAADALTQFPPILAFQSLADATIPPLSVADHLLDRLPANGSELVVFDVNHTTQAEDLLRPDAAASALTLESRPPDPYAITLITNESPESPKVVARHRGAEDTEWREVRVGLRWPEGVYSLSHLALPFPADDPPVRRGTRSRRRSPEARRHRSPRRAGGARHAHRPAHAPPLQPLLRARREARREAGRGVRPLARRLTPWLVSGRSCALPRRVTPRIASTIPSTCSSADGTATRRCSSSSSGTASSKSGARTRSISASSPTRARSRRPACCSTSSGIAVSTRQASSSRDRGGWASRSSSRVCSNRAVRSPIATAARRAWRITSPRPGSVVRDASQRVRIEGAVQLGGRDAAGYGRRGGRGHVAVRRSRPRAGQPLPARAPVRRRRAHARRRRGAAGPHAGGTAGLRGRRCPPRTAPDRGSGSGAARTREAAAPKPDGRPRLHRRPDLGRRRADHRRCRRGRPR